MFRSPADCRIPKIKRATKYLAQVNLHRRSLLRHYATNREVAGSIPDEAIGFLFQFI
jgi:hypothetical protein